MIERLSGEFQRDPEVSQNERPENMVDDIRRATSESLEASERPAAPEVPPPPSQDVVSARPSRRNDEPDAPEPRRGLDSILVLGSHLRYALEWLVRPGLRRRNREAREELWRLRRTKKIYAFLNSKGASGKTAGSTTTGLLFAEAIKRDCVVVDMNDSPGGTARRLGIKRRDTLQLQEYLRRYRGGEFPSTQSIADNLEWPRESGLFVISSEAVAKTTVPKYQAKLGLEKLAEGFHSVFCDLGNGIKSSGNLGAVEVADTLVFMGNVNSADSVVDFRREDPTDEGDDLRNTMQAYASLGMPEKVRNGIIVVLGARPNMRKRYAEHYRMPVERVFIIPNNRYMKRGNVVRKNRLPLGVRVVIYEILVAMMKAEEPPAHEIKRTTSAEKEQFERGDPTQDGDTEEIPKVGPPPATGQAPPPPA
jgi:cellulose biosynthesis protein BcsQ